MIIYSKDYWGYGSVTRLYGSAIPRSLPAALFSAGIALLFEFFGEQGTMNEWFSRFDNNISGPARLPTPYPFQVFAFVVGFMLVFRSTFSYRRYWEGRTELQNMTAMFTAVVLEVVNFDLGTLPEDSSKRELEKANTFGESFLHYMSLLHGMAIQSLRKDWDLQNLIPHDQLEMAPPSDAAELIKRHIEANVGQHQCDDEKCEKVAWWWPVASKLKKFHAHFQLTDVVFLRSSRKARMQYNKMVKLPIVGGISEDEKVALGSRVDYIPKTGESKGCVLSNGIVVPGPGERVSVVAAWVNQILQDRRREGGLRVHPAIVTRVFAALSGGLLGYEQARKLVDTPFPFPWAQIVSVVLVIFAVMLPLVTAAVIDQWAVTAVVTFISTWAHYALNEVSRDLEDPFIYDPNDLPVARQQWVFNERILALGRTKRPVSNSELGVTRLRSIRSALSGDGQATDMTIGRLDSRGVKEKDFRIGGLSTVIEDVLNYGEDESNQASGSGELGPEQAQARDLERSHSGHLVLEDIYHETRLGGSSESDSEGKGSEEDADESQDPPHDVPA